MAIATASYKGMSLSHRPVLPSASLYTQNAPATAAMTTQSSVSAFPLGPAVLPDTFALPDAGAVLIYASMLLPTVAPGNKQLTEHV
jgi:hypothetical protein